jgi:C-terminal processing protease CtpA/Prc
VKAKYLEDVVEALRDHNGDSVRMRVRRYVAGEGVPLSARSTTVKSARDLVLSEEISTDPVCHAIEIRSSSADAPDLIPVVGTTYPQSSQSLARPQSREKAKSRPQLAEISEVDRADTDHIASQMYGVNHTMVTDLAAREILREQIENERKVIVEQTECSQLFNPESITVLERSDTEDIIEFYLAKTNGQLGIYVRRDEDGEDSTSDGLYIHGFREDSEAYGQGFVEVGDEVLALNHVNVEGGYLDDLVSALRSDSADISEHRVHIVIRRRFVVEYDETDEWV